MDFWNATSPENVVLKNIALKVSLKHNKNSLCCVLDGIPLSNQAIYVFFELKIK